MTFAAVAERRAPTQRERRVCASSSSDSDTPKLSLVRLRAGDRLEHQIHGRPALDRLERARHVRQHAGLRGHLVARDDGVEHLEQPHHVRDVVERRVDADDRVAAAVEQAVEHAGGDAGEVVGRMVRLQPRRHAARQPDRVAKAGDDAALARRQHEVLGPHDLRDGRDHLRRDARRDARQRVGVHVVGEQPLAEAADGQVGDRREGGGVVPVHDEPRDLVVLVGNDGLLQERASGTSASAICAAARCTADAAATPASRSPERAGVAQASSVRRSSNTWRVPSITCA